MSALFNYYSLSLFLGGFIALISAVVVLYTNRKSLAHLSWFLLNISSAIWSFGYFAMITGTGQAVGTAANIILHQGAIFIPCFYLLFVLALTKKTREHILILVIAIIAVLFFSLINPTHYFIDGVFPKYIFNFAPNAGPLYKYFTIYFFSIIIYALAVLFYTVVKTVGIEARRLRLIFYASLAGFAGGGSVFFLTFNVPVPPYTIALYSIYPALTAYVILRYNLFDVKVIATELFIFLLWIVLAVQALLADSTPARILGTLVFGGVVVVGLVLIRSVIREVKSREKIESLAFELSSANAELKKLDTAKSEFISIAGHQLRTPLTVIKGYTSMVLEGSFGQVAEKSKEALNRVLTASTALAKLVSDLLDLSRIETGKIKYEFKEIQIKDIVHGVLQELEETAKSKNINLEFTSENVRESKVIGDFDKLHEVIINLVDNAIKYSAIGPISISLKKTARDGAGQILLAVEDRGMGIKPEDIPNLFIKFGRSDEAKKVRPDGMGLGLYFVKKIIEDHKGRVWVESPGIGQGSTFFIELPVQ